MDSSSLIKTKLRHYAQINRWTVPLFNYVTATSIIINMDEEKWLLQEDTHDDFLRLGKDQWTTVYRSWHASGQSNGGIYCGLASPEYRNKALMSSSWDLTLNDGRPGFSQHVGDDGEWVTTYFRYGGGREVEPLIIKREFHGIRPSYNEISEEFRLYHNLWWDENRSCFIKPHEDGTEEVAIEMAEDEIRIKTRLLRQYQAARQQEILFFVDSVRFATSGSSVLPPDQKWEDKEIYAERYANPLKPLGITRYLGTRALAPPPIEKSGIWPFEEQDDYFPEFIIGQGDDGDIRYSCNPDALANYFGANPEAPHYLTPVHFRKDVLQKYYENPEIYSVEDGYLRCAGLWGVQMDNDHPDRVVLFLGDIGRDLPKSERDYWKSFNIAPDSGVSRTAIQRAFMGEFADPDAPDLRFRRLYSRLMEHWSKKEGWSLFQEPKGADKQLLQRLRVPLNESQAEFENAVEMLAKLVSDGLDTKALQKQLPNKVKGEKSISKLERWLRKEGYSHVDRDIKLLRDIQELRSKVSAHRKGSSYEKTLTGILGDARGTKAIVMLLNQTNLMLQSLYQWRIEGTDSGYAYDEKSQK